MAINERRGATSHAAREQQHAVAAFQAERLKTSAEAVSGARRQRLACEASPVTRAIPLSDERQVDAERLAWRGIAPLGPAELRARHC